MGIVLCACYKLRPPILLNFDKLHPCQKETDVCWCCSTAMSDDLILILAIVGGAVLLVIIAVIFGIVIWRIRASQDVSSSPEPSSPIIVSSAPAVNTRFIPSQSCCNNDTGYYNSYYNNGYHANEYSPQYPSPCFHSRVNVQSV